MAYSQLATTIGWRNKESVPIYLLHVYVPTYPFALCRFLCDYTQLLNSKTGVYRGKLFFLIFDTKHRLWVPTINVLSKYVKNIKSFMMKFSIFMAEKFSVYCIGNKGHTDTI